MNTTVWNDDPLKCPLCGVKTLNWVTLLSRTTNAPVWMCPQCRSECRIARDRARKARERCYA